MEREYKKEQGEKWTPPVINTNDAQTALVSVYRLVDYHNIKKAIAELKNYKEGNYGNYFDKMRDTLGDFSEQFINFMRTNYGDSWGAIPINDELTGKIESILTEEEKFLERFFINCTTHTYKNQGCYGNYNDDWKNHLIGMGIPYEFHWMFLSNATPDQVIRGGEVNFTKAGLHAANSRKAVAAVHAYEVAQHDPGMKLYGITNGDDRELSTKYLRAYLNKNFLNKEYLNNNILAKIVPVLETRIQSIKDEIQTLDSREKNKDEKERMEKVLRETLNNEEKNYYLLLSNINKGNEGDDIFTIAAKSRSLLIDIVEAFNNDENGISIDRLDDIAEESPDMIAKGKEIGRMILAGFHNLDPDNKIISYSGRWVDEKRGKRAFVPKNIEDLIKNGANVVIYGNVQASTESQELGEHYRKIAEDLNKKGHPGKVIFVDKFTLDEQLQLLAATDVQIQDSDRGTGASEYTESDVTANGGLSMGPPYHEGVIQDHTLPMNYRNPGWGGSLVPEDINSQSYVDQLMRIVQMPRSDLKYYQANSITQQSD